MLFTGFDFFSIANLPLRIHYFRQPCPPRLPKKSRSLNHLSLEMGRCLVGSGPLDIRDSLLRPRRASRRAPDCETRTLLNFQQRLRRFNLLRLLQGFLGHFVSPSFDLPYWASAHIHAKQSPNSAAAPRNRNPLNLRHFALEPLSSHPATHPRSVELIITR